LGSIRALTDREPIAVSAVSKSAGRRANSVIPGTDRHSQTIFVTGGKHPEALGEVMPPMFPHALLACINEGRAPMPQELACVAAKIRREAFPASLGSGAPHPLSLSMAHAAMHGDGADA
jgi:hypothetical protein